MKRSESLVTISINDDRLIVCNTPLQRSPATDVRPQMYSRSLSGLDVINGRVYNMAKLVTYIKQAASSMGIKPHSYLTFATQESIYESLMRTAPVRPEDVSEVQNNMVLTYAHLIKDKHSPVYVSAITREQLFQYCLFAHHVQMRLLALVTEIWALWKGVGLHECPASFWECTIDDFKNQVTQRALEQQREKDEIVHGAGGDMPLHDEVVMHKGLFQIGKELYEQS